MHMFGRTFSKFHSMFERVFFYPKVLCDKTRLPTSTVKILYAYARVNMYFVETDIYICFLN